MRLSKLKYYILANGISQGELAEYLKMNKKTLCWKLNGKSEFTYSEIVKIKDYLKLSKEMFCELFELFFE